MSPLSPIITTVSPPGVLDTRLHGRRLLLARGIWVALAGFALVFFVVSLPGYWTHLQTICAGSTCADKQLTPAAAQALRGLSISVGTYALFAFTLTLFAAGIWLTVGGVLAWRKSDDWMALGVSLTLVLQGIANLTGASSSVAYAQLTLSSSARLLNFFAFTALFFVISLFPNGRFVPRWFAWLVIPFLADALWYNFFSYGHAGLLLPGWMYGVSDLLFVGLVLSGGTAQLYRYRQVSTPVQRQQTKLVVFGLLANVLVVVGLLVPTWLVPSLGRPGSLYTVVLTPLDTLSTLLIPLSLGVAILRYRLWDIDTLINKALVYGGLSVLLAMLYLGLVIGLESLIGFVFGQTSQPVVIVVSTLAIAALFQPLRSRFQRLIDHRFYRSKYDAIRTLEAFSATLRNEVDLEHVSEHLLSVVQETMRPASVSLWLLKPHRRAGVTSPEFRSPSEIDRP